LAGAALVAGVFLVRPARALAYVEAHPVFLAAVAAVGAAGLALAAVAAAVLPSSEDGASGDDRQGPPAARSAAVRS
jgi:hypothetical protein